MFTFPLHHGDEQLGALDVYRTEEGAMDPATMSAGQTLADVASAYLLNAQARDALHAVSERAHHRSLHDSLTGLPNRSLLLQRLDHGIELSRQTGNTVAVLSVDLDQFKVVNGAYGHHVGDQLLIALAERLTGRLHGDVTVARLASDEFVVLCDDLVEPSSVKDIATTIELALSERFLLDDAEVKLTASIGIAFASTDDRAERVLQAADTAMYRAKRLGGARCFTVAPPQPTVPG